MTTGKERSSGSPVRPSEGMDKRTRPYLEARSIDTSIAVPSAPEQQEEKSLPANKCFPLCTYKLIRQPRLSRNNAPCTTPQSSGYPFAQTINSKGHQGRNNHQTAHRNSQFYKLFQSSSLLGQAQEWGTEYAPLYPVTEASLNQWQPSRLTATPRVCFPTQPGSLYNVAACSLLQVSPLNVGGNVPSVLYQEMPIMLSAGTTWEPHRSKF